MNPDNHTWDLLVGALKGTLGEAEQREFDRWAAEAENRRFYNNLTRVWREIQQRAAAYERTATGCGGSCSNGSEPTKFRMRTSFRNVAGATCCKWP